MLKILSKKLLIPVAILLIGGVAFAIYHKNSNQPANGNSDGINYGPPTSQDKQDAEANKKTIDEKVTQQNNLSGDASSKKQVVPMIVSYGQTSTDIEVSARVPGILETSGTCTLTMAKGSYKVTATRTASPNVDEMSCGFIAIPRSKLSAGSWSATVSYSSGKAYGTSVAQAIGVK